jgi:hypothetical protein
MAIGAFLIDHLAEDFWKTDRFGMGRGGGQADN